MNNNFDVPLVSICIPTYNGAQYIKDCLDSALDQTYKNIEIIICDDNSNDETLNICESYRIKHKNIKIFKNEKNLGLVKNWINVINKASSSWIKFLFQDDLIEADCVQIMMNSALKHKVNFVFCNRKYFFESNVSEKIRKRYNSVENPENIFPENTKISSDDVAKLINTKFFNNCIGEPPCYLFNKLIIEENSFPIKYKQIIDYIFVLNTISKNDFVFINQNLVKFRVHLSSESMSSSLNKDSFEKNLYVKYFERLLLCHDLVHNPKFKSFKNQLSLGTIETIRDWTVLKSFKRLGYKKVLDFYQKQDIKDFILNKRTLKFNKFKYKLFKLKTKQIRNKFKV